ncbi:MAG TPA: hypothetical protein VNU22_08160 [Candidatus Acidoferrum sp.]|jgi:hypothetical protein|nr:hypothetical protein [Candidatus Acidoferrum sp.]
MHGGHTHEHGPGCSHPTVRHAGHTDYLHDGHLHFVHDGHVDEHVVEASAVNPEACTSGHSCEGLTCIATTTSPLRPIVNLSCTMAAS